MDSADTVDLADFVAILIPYIVVVIITGIPALRIFGRLGLSRAWALLAIIPLGNILVIWIIAYKCWPVEELTKAQRP